MSILLEECLYWFIVQNLLFDFFFSNSMFRTMIETARLISKQNNHLKYRWKIVLFALECHAVEYFYCYNSNSFVLLSEVLLYSIAFLLFALNLYNVIVIIEISCDLHTC